MFGKKNKPEAAQSGNTQLPEAHEFTNKATGSTTLVIGCMSNPTFTHRMDSLMREVPEKYSARNRTAEYRNKSASGRKAMRRSADTCYQYGE